MRIVRILIGLLIFACLVPPAVLVLTGLIARWAGCDIDPDAPVRCIIMDGNYGDILHALTRFGWLTIASIPIMAGVIAVWILIEVISRLRSPAKSAPQTPANSRNRDRGS